MKLAQEKIFNFIRDLKPSSWECSSSGTLSEKIAESYKKQGFLYENILLRKLYEKALDCVLVHLFVLLQLIF